MSTIALVLNLLLGALMLAALGVGWRLDRRLKALRDSHQSFANAVDDLDRAAARAEQGLADLRAATDEAAETLAGRIEKAKALSIKLDASIDRAAARPEPAAAATTHRPRDVRTDLILEEIARPERRPDRSIERPNGERLASRLAERVAERASQRAAEAELPERPVESIAERMAERFAARIVEPAPERPTGASLRASFPAFSTPRARPALDDDLFETPGRRAAGGAR